MTDHQHWDELAAGYALHALAPDEELSFIEHLASCARCAASVSEHDFVAAQLGSMAHYRGSEQAPAWESIRGAVVAERGAGGSVVDLAGRRRRYDVSRRVLAVAAAVAIIAGGGIVAWRLSTGGSSTCTASAGCHAVTLDAAAGRSEAALIVRGDVVSLTPTNISAAPAGKVYVLWQLPRNGRATPVTTFDAVSATTPATGTLRVPYSDTAAFAISVESAAGAPPSTPSNTVASATAS
jgi:anti-sigma-K factor RskA